MGSKKFVVMFLVLVALVTGGAYMVRFAVASGESGGKATLAVPKAAETAPGAAAGEAPGRVAVVPVESVEQPGTIRLTGSLAADEQSKVASNASGIVQDVRVERGSMVEKGDVLVQLDPTDARNMLAEGEAAVDELTAALGWRDTSKPFVTEEQPGVKAAKAALDLAQANHKRYSDLFAEKAIAKAAYDQVSTEYESAQQQYQQALNQAQQLYQSYLRATTRLAMLKKAVADTTIVAPFSGWVAEKNVSAGERVSGGGGGGNGGSIATIVKIDPLRLVLTVPQQHAGLVAQGQQVDFRVDAFPDKTFTGEIRFVGPSVENNSRSLTVEALVANPDRQLLPGFFATAELATSEKRTRLYIPEGAVIRQGDTANAFVVRDSVARETVVALGETKDGKIEIVSGLAPGDVVVMEPGKVHDGDRIQ